MKSALRELLIVFTRFPEQGTVKTRLIPVLGPDRAADLHTQMVKHTLQRARDLRRHRAINVEIWFDGGSEQRMQSLFGEDAPYRVQASGDLGARLTAAFHSSFDRRYDRAVIVGTDCPALSEDVMGDAFDALAAHELVLGPARDGGYYLVGLRRAERRLFAAISWSTEAVLRQTLKIADDVGISYKLLTTLDDVDRPADLAIWERFASGAGEIVNFKP